MKSFRTARYAGRMLAMLASPIVSAQDEEEEPIVPATIDELLAEISDALEEHHTPGIAIAIVNEDGPEYIGALGKDGISYLISLKRQHIRTPLMADYETEILRVLDAATLQDALARARTLASNEQAPTPKY